MRPLRHLPDILHRLREKPFQLHAYNYWKDGRWTTISSHQIIERIYYIALSLSDLGLKKGDRIGICAKSSPYWSITDFAIVLAGGVTVPFFSNLSHEHFSYQVEQSSPRWIFIGDQDDWENVSPYQKHFEGIIGIEKGAEARTSISFQSLINTGEEIHKKDPSKVHKLENAIKPDDLATIIYSSGSTGLPKGVELTHKNLVSIIHYDDFTLRSNDKYLSILPLAHIFAKQIHLIMTAWGIPIYFLNDLKKIPDVTKEVSITRMITVPRVLEKAYSKMCERIKNASFLKRNLAAWAFKLAHREKGLYKTLMHPIADRLVYSKIRDGFGKHFHSILSGGAALNPHLHRFYLSLGIPVLQGWGLTEGSCIAVNRLSHNKIGTVGPPMESITFKISDEGEVLAKGPTIMRGYHKNIEATKKAVDSEGWLHTGDYGYLDKDGHLVIQGRINESFKTSQGEFVNPQPIEQKICESPLIDMAMIIGENFPFPSVLLFPDLDSVERLKKKEGLAHLKNEEFLKTNVVKKEFEKILEEVNKSLDHWQKVRKYQFILIPPSVEGGELTPTLKLRRKVILSKYKDKVHDLYKDSLILK